VPGEQLGNGLLRKVEAKVKVEVKTEV